MKLSEIVILEAADDKAGQICTKFAPSTKSCNPGCKTIHVGAGDKCPYTQKTMFKCPCFA